MKTIYIVQSGHGEYEDYEVHNLRTFFKQESAEKYKDFLYAMKKLQQEVRSTFIQNEFDPPEFSVPEPEMDTKYKEKMVHKMQSPVREERGPAQKEWTKYKHNFDERYRIWNMQCCEFRLKLEAEFDEIEGNRFKNHVNSFVNNKNLSKEIENELLRNYGGMEFMIDECEHFEEEQA
jgi:hypothetical protein